MSHFQTATETMQKARTAFAGWRERSINERVRFVGALRKLIIARVDQIMEEICRETGKVPAEAINSDILPTLEMIKYYEKSAPDTLSPQKRKTSFLFFKNEAYLEYKPIGVVLIIAPWNCPFQLALVPVVTALLAGNTVILKPASVTPSVNSLIDELCVTAGLPPDVVQVITGGPEAGAQLIKARPDMIFFTGSVATGKKIMEMAAEHLIPLVLELGGKDPMIVFDDADLDRAVEAAVYGAFAGSGQLCVSIERLYVQRSAYGEFASRLVERVKRLRVGSGVDCDLGPMTTVSQIEIVEAHVNDAVAKGAKLLTEVRKDGNLFYPVVIKDVTHDMKLMQEETFGPVLPIMPFVSEEEAIALANDSSFGLNASVWSGDREKAARVARRLETGNVYINDVIKNIGNPTLPFGGVKQSGFGKYHGPEGLHSFSIETSVMVNKNKGKREVNWFPFDRELVENLKKLLRLLYEEIPWFEKVRIFLSMRSLVKKD